MNEAIYLDNNATSHLDPDVAAAMHECQLACHGNPASQHRAGQRARVVLEDARERIADVLNVDISSPASDRLIFTSGGTEANNLALRGLGRDDTSDPRSIIVSLIEHPSILTTAGQIAKTEDVQYVNCLKNGVVDIDHFATLLARGRATSTVVSVMTANNETGVIQPIREIASIGHDVHPTIQLHTDAVQVVGKLPVSFQELGIAAMTISAHKFHGPCGIGALAIRKGVPLLPQVFGGNQQLRLRPGTESVAAAVGMAVALEKWQSEAATRANQMSSLRDRFEEQLLSEIDDITINGQTSRRLPHTTNVSFLGVDRQALLMALDFAGIYCSTGSACESGSSEPSHVLKAMGLTECAVSSAIRFSLSAATTASEIDESVRRISKLVKGLRKHKSGPISDV